MPTKLNLAPAVVDYFGMHKLLSANAPSWMSFVEKHGAAFIPAPRPRHVRKQPFGECFRNSANFVEENPGYIYVEGFAMMELGVVTQHAWCIDDEGIVLDVTWENPEHCQYYGIPFMQSYVEHIAYTTKIWGILGPNNFELLELEPEIFLEMPPLYSSTCLQR
jgi:hypothetical protein